MRKRNPNFPWTPALEAELRRRYPHEKTADIARDFGTKYQVVSNRAYLLKLHKSEAFLASDLSGRITDGKLGKDTRFCPGHSTRSWPRKPKPRSRPDWKGPDWVPVGTERLKADGCVWVKIAEPSVWRQKHWLAWKDAHGTFPPPYTKFLWKDGDKRNCAPDNLELISCADWMRRYTMHNYPAPLKQAIWLNIRLRRKLNEND